MHPTDSKRMLVRYFNGGDGAFVTTDGGKNWKLLCDSFVLGPAAAHGGPLMVTTGGTTIMGVSDGLWHDDGHACGWTSEAKYAGAWIAGFARDPIDPAITYAATSNGGTANGLLRRDARGTWSDLGTKADVLITDVLVAPHGSGRRFYVGAAKGEITPIDGGKSESNYVIRVSDDDGATWTEHVYGAASGLLNVQAVDPTNADRLVISIERPGDAGPLPATADTVLVSSDQGRTFEPYLTVTEIGGVTFAPDGRIWIGDAGNGLDPTQPQGLYFAKSLDAPATQLPMSNYPVQCLGFQPATDTLYACQRWTFGTVDTADGTFTTSLDVRKVGSFVDCAGVDMAAACQAQLCSAYCGFGHFAQAPLCCAYDTFSCGPAAAQSAICPPTGAAGRAAVDGGKAGAGAEGGSGGVESGGSGGSSGSDPDAGRNGGASGSPDAGTAASDGKGSHAGCGCTVAAPVRPGAGSIKVLLLAAAFVLGRRRSS